LSFVGSEFIRTSDPSKAQLIVGQCTEKTQNSIEIPENINGICRNFNGISENIGDILTLVGAAAELEVRCGRVGGAPWPIWGCAVAVFRAQGGGDTASPASYDFLQTNLVNFL